MHATPWISRIGSLIAAITLAALLVSGDVRTEDAPPAKTDAAATAAIPPFPPGFDYPATQAINAAIAARDTARLRQHGWWLWAGLNKATGGDKPLWWSWPTSTQAFANASPSGTEDVAKEPGSDRTQKRHMIAANVANTPIDLPAPWYPVPLVSNGTCQTGSSTNLPDGNQFQANGDVMIAGVIYDAGAFDWMRGQRVYSAGNLTAQWQAGKKAIAPFPSSSIVLKHMYWPAKGDDLTALPVWDPSKFPPDYPNYIGYELWPRVVIIDPSGKPVQRGKTGVSTFLYHFFEADKKTPFKTRLGSGPVVSINDFYHHRVSDAELRAMSANDRRILDASACWLYNRPFQKGDLLVSIAMHIITREVDRWTFQSVWWHDKPKAGPFAANRPDIPASQAPGPWAHYLMTIEYGITESPGMLPISYNPYIELAAAHPIKTNCRNCHFRAAWPSSFNVHISPPPKITASYEATAGPGPLADLKATDPIFNNLLLLDFQWAISDRAD